MSLFGIVVLLVEDDNQVAGIVEAILKDCQPEGWTVQYNVKRAGTLHDAQKYISRGGWDVIISDLGLPDSKGIETFRACYAIAQAPIIVYSGTASMEDCQQILREGADRCFEKQHMVKSSEWLHYTILSCIETYRLRTQVERLQNTLLHELRNLITACSNCHRWRDPASNDYMQPDKFLEKYGIFLSHGICPECAALLYGDIQP